MIRCHTPVPGTTPGAVHAGYVTALMSRLVQYVRTFSEEPAYTPHCILVTQTESCVETATTEAGTSLLRSAVIQPPKAQSFSDFGGGGGDGRDAHVYTGSRPTTAPSDNECHPRTSGHKFLPIRILGERGIWQGQILAVWTTFLNFKKIDVHVV